MPSSQGSTARYDLLGENQIDQGQSLLVESRANYSDMAATYIDTLDFIVSYHTNFSDGLFTANYRLDWFDYESGYDAVLTEFGWNHSRQLL